MRVSKFAAYLFVGALWIGIIALGATLERVTNIQRPLSFGVMMFLATLAMYPIMMSREAKDRNLTFKRWTLAMFIASSITTVLLYIKDFW